MTKPTNNSHANAVQTHARKAADAIQHPTIVPKDSALSQVLEGGADDPATVSLALQDLAMLASDTNETRIAEDSAELLRNGLLIVANSIESWTKSHAEHRSVLADLNGPPKT